MPGQGSIDAHRGALEGFVAWADPRNHGTPAAFTRATLETCQLHLHHFRSPRSRQPLVLNQHADGTGASLPSVPAASTFDIDTIEPIDPPWLTIKEWIPDDEPDLDCFNRPRNPSNPDPDGFDQRPGWQPAEIHFKVTHFKVTDK